MPEQAKLRDDLVSSQSVIDDQTVYTLKDPVTGRYFRLREPEFWLIQQLDGETSPEDAAERFRDKFQLNISADNVRQFIDTLENLLFLENSRSEQGISRASYGAATKKRLASRIFFLKIKAFSPGRLLDILASLYKPFHHPFWFVIQGIGIMIGLALLWANASQFGVNITEIYNVSSIATIVISLFILVTLHEFAHAIICRHYGGSVPEMGFLLMYLQPCFYCDLSDAWLFEKKSHRLAVTFAGPYFQLILLAVSIIIWRLTVPTSDINEIARVIVIVSWVSYLFNFNPLIKLDGYYLLSDWLDIPNLRQKSFSYLGNLLKRGILGWPIDAVRVTKREKRVFVLYSLLALTYTTLLIGYILFVVAGFMVDRFGGAGLILLLAVVFAIFRGGIGSFAQGVIRQIGYAKEIFKKPLRLAVYVIVLLAILVASLAIPLPHRVTGEVVVLPIAQFTLSVNELGLLESNLRYGGKMPGKSSSFLQMVSNDMAAIDLVPLVQDGQKVQRGDTIAILSSNQMTREIAEAQAELDKLDSELDLLKASPKEEEITEAVAEVRVAQANLDQAERNHERITRLVERNLDTAEKLEASETALNVAQAELANKTSKLQLLKSPPRPEEEAVLMHKIQKQKAYRDFLGEQADAQLIVAPIGGTVLTRTDDDEILRITNDDMVELMVPVSDFDVTLVEVGQTAKIKIRSYPNRLFTGSVVRVPAGADVTGEKPSFPVSVVVDNPDDQLHVGMSGYAKIEVGQASLVRLIGRKVTSVLRVEFWSWW
jgi:putative peptide zinc metalloprotease protein